MGDQSELMVLPPSALEAAKRVEKWRRSKQKGYADIPGTGPAGEFCKTCAHYTHRHLAGTYRKCALRAATWTGGYGSDILANAPACRKWEKPAGGQS
jgi:hypothetical protein